MRVRNGGETPQDSHAIDLAAVDHPVLIAHSRLGGAVAQTAPSPRWIPRVELRAVSE